VVSPVMPFVLISNKMKNTNIKKTTLIFLVLVLFSLSVSAIIQSHPFSQITAGAADISNNTMNLTGSGDYLLSVINTNPNSFSSAIYGISSSSGASFYGQGSRGGYGVMGSVSSGISGIGLGAQTSSSTSIAALKANASSSAGVNYGVWAQTQSNAGRAVFGYASPTISTAPVYGIYSQVDSPDGYSGFFNSSGKGLYITPGPVIQYNITAHLTESGSPHTLPIGQHHYCSVYWMRAQTEQDNHCDNTCQVTYNASYHWTITVAISGANNCRVTCGAACFDFI